jgi:surfactin synthase thioesterase subunit
MGGLLAYALLVELQRRQLPLPVRLFVSSVLVPHAGFFGPFHPSMSDEELADGLRRIVRSLGALEPIPELLALFVRILRGDLEMGLHYRPPGPRRLPCPITTLSWSDDPDVRPQDMVGWSAYGDVRPHVLNGDHFSFLAPSAELLAVVQTDFALLPTHGSCSPGNTRAEVAW